jgi:hypothetical protein
MKTNNTFFDFRTNFKKITKHKNEFKAKAASTAANRNI